MFLLMKFKTVSISPKARKKQGGGGGGGNCKGKKRAF